MKAFGIFEGGGAKGFAHIGALKAAEARRVKFIGVAGTSAGSIVAALAAANYESDELFNPRPDATTRGIFDKNFLEFLDPQSWENLQLLTHELRGFFDDSNTSRTFVKKFVRKLKITRAVAQWKDAHLFYLRHHQIISRFWNERGFFVTDKFVEWLDNHLAARVKRNVVVGKVVFEDMPIPLVVIATDLTTQCIKIFSKEKTPKASVANAVAASISIPFVFKPITFEGLQLVDGGLLSNFPAWVFDDERQQLDDFVPTFGFKLHKAPSVDVELRQETTLTFVSDLFSTALSGDGVLETRAIENLSLVPLKVRGNTLDFDIEFEKKEDLYVYGKNSAHDFFRDYIGPYQPEDVLDVLAITRTLVKEAIGKKKTHLRLNVMMPVGQKKNKFRILYPFNMNKDADDRLELGLDVGAAGRCWQTHSPVVVNLLEAKNVFETEWKLNKYQQALIRSSLRSLLSVPIFDMDKFDNSRPAVENPVLGLLSIDSDEELTEDFARVEVQQAAADGAKVIARALRI